jgi:uncharacterized protein (UPF0335 family)
MEFSIYMTKQHGNKHESLADEQPMSITELQPLVEEFVNKLRTIENEIKLLGEDKKALVDEYATRLDVKTLKAAMRVVEVREKVGHKDAFDSFVEVLERL